MMKNDFKKMQMEAPKAAPPPHCAQFCGASLLSAAFCAACSLRRLTKNPSAISRLREPKRRPSPSDDDSRRECQKPKGTLESAASAVACAVDNAAAPCLGNSARTHRTRFKRDVKRRVGEPMIGEGGSSSTQRNDFGMRRGISAAKRLVAAARAITLPSATTTAPTGISPAIPASCASSSAIRMKERSASASTGGSGGRFTSRF